MYIDTHCHLNFPQFDSDRAMVIGNAKKAGVKQFIVPGVNRFSSQQVVELAKRHPGVLYVAVGFHPYEAQNNPNIQILENLLSSPSFHLPVVSSARRPIVAIGECGLDYHQYGNEPALGKKQQQKILFEQQLEIALKYDLPVIVHCRAAFEDLFKVLGGLPRMPRGVIHCFGGGLQEVRMAQEYKFYIGIDGNVTYSKQLSLIVSQIPLAMLLLETDAPYLPPVPYRGQRNEPKYISLIAKKIAEFKKTSVKQVEQQTTANAQSLFRLLG